MYFIVTLTTTAIKFIPLLIKSSTISFTDRCTYFILLFQAIMDYLDFMERAGFSKVR